MNEGREEEKKRDNKGERETEKEVEMRCRERHTQRETERQTETVQGLGRGREKGGFWSPQEPTTLGGSLPRIPGVGVGL